MTNVCLFTDSAEPSGVGEHMLTLADELKSRYRLSFVCPATPAGLAFLRRAREMGVNAVAVDPRPEVAHRDLERWLRGGAGGDLPSDDRGLAAAVGGHPGSTGASPIDVLHAHAGILWEGHDGVRAARAAGVPVVVRTEHLVYVSSATSHQRARHAEMTAQVDALICVSACVRKSFAAAGIAEGKLRVIRNGIRPKQVPAEPAGVRRRLGLSEEARLVLSVGRLTVQKGHVHLVEALPGIVAQVPDAHAVVVGDGPLAEDLHDLARSLRVTDHLHLVGRRDDVAELMAGSDVVVLPSLFEGMPLVPLEAMAFGVPVVGTWVCGTPEVVVDGVTGRLVEPADPDALAQAVVEVLTSPEAAAAWGRAGRARVDELSSTVMGRQVAALYDELLSRAPRRRRAPSPSGATMAR